MNSHVITNAEFSMKTISHDDEHGATEWEITWPTEVAGLTFVASDNVSTPGLTTYARRLIRERRR